MYIRQGDLILQKVDSLPEGLKKKEDTILLEGEASNHFHVLDRADVYLAPQAPSKENDYLIGYFQTKEGSLLTHEEHKTIEVPAGMYRFYHQREYSEIEERKVID